MEKNLFIKTHGFPSKQKYSEDGNLWIKCLQYESIYYLNEELVDYGSGKSMFGASGLSANTKKMHKGVLKNIKDAYLYGLINKMDLYFFSFFEILKYIRRVFLLKINNSNQVN